VKIKNWNSCVPDEVRKKPDWMPIYPFEKIVTPRSISSPFLRGINGPGGTEEALEEKNDPGRRKTRRAAEKSAAANSEIARADRADSLPPTHTQYTSVASGSNTTAAAASRISVPATTSKPSDDRTVLTAAGGMTYIASMEKLPPETAKLFDRDPVSGQVLWFSGPPIDIPRPRKPQHSLEYLHFLVKKRKREREKAANGALSKDTPREDMLIDDDDPPPVKIPRKRIHEMIDEMWDEIMVGETNTSS